MNTNLSKKYSFAALLLALLLTVLFSLGKTFRYYFYSDDYTMLMLHEDNAWVHDHKVYDIFYGPFYKLFGTQPEGYFALGILTYFCAAVAVFFFIRALTQNNLIAALSSLIFSTGFIGVNHFTQGTHSGLNNVNVVLVALTLLLFVFWLDSRKLRWYIAAFLMYSFTINGIAIRAFPLILFLPTIDVISSFKLEHPVKILKKLAFVAIRFIPFFLVAYFVGIFSFGWHYFQFDPGGDTVPSYGKILDLFTSDSVKEVFALLGRFVLLGPSTNDFFDDYVIGVIFFFGITLVAFFSFRNYPRLGRSLLIALFLTVEGYIGIMMLLGFFPINHTNRYLVIVMMGYSAIFPILVYLLLQMLGNVTKRKNLVFLAPVLILPLIVIMASSSRKYEDAIIQERSNPAREFYRQLSGYLPSISGKNIFYFDAADYHPVGSRFGGIILAVGTYPKSATLAIPYKVPLESVKVVDDFDAVLAALRDKEVVTSNIHTFYYDEAGLHSTKDKVLTLLEKGDRREIPTSQIVYGDSVLNPQLEIPLSNISSLTPMIVNLDLKITPISSSYFEFPFYGLGKKYEIERYYEEENPDKGLIFEYLTSRRKYYDNVKLEVSSVNNKPVIHPSSKTEFLVDDKIGTWYMTSLGPWQDGHKPWIKLNLGENRRISRLIWYPLKNREPSNYQLLVSRDGASWKEVKTISMDQSLDDGKQSINIKSLSFAPVWASFVMLQINNTTTGGEPALSEIEVIEDKYKNVDLQMALRIKAKPFEFIRDEKDLKETYDYIVRYGVLNLKTLTNNDENISIGGSRDVSGFYNLRIPVQANGLNNRYKIAISPRGTEMTKIKLQLNYPAKIEVKKIAIIHPTLEQLKPDLTR